MLLESFLPDSVLMVKQLSYKPDVPTGIYIISHSGQCPRIICTGTGQTHYTVLHVRIPLPRWLKEMTSLQLGAGVTKHVKHRTWRHWTRTDLTAFSLRINSHSIRCCRISIQELKQPIVLYFCMPNTTPITGW